MGSAETAKSEPALPVGVNHIVLNVRDIEQSHEFWTDIVGLRLVGEFRQRPCRPRTPECGSTVVSDRGRPSP